MPRSDRLKAEIAAGLYQERNVCLLSSFIMLKGREGVNSNYKGPHNQLLKSELNYDISAILNISTADEANNYFERLYNVEKELVNHKLTTAYQTNPSGPLPKLMEAIFFTVKVAFALKHGISGDLRDELLFDERVLRREYLYSRIRQDLKEALSTTCSTYAEKVEFVDEILREVQVTPTTKVASNQSNKYAAVTIAAIFGLAAGYIMLSGGPSAVLNHEFSLSKAGSRTIPFVPTSP